MERCAETHRVGTVRVPYFCDLLALQKHRHLAAARERDIVRRHGKRFLRYAATAVTVTGTVTSTQESLR